MAAQRLDAFGFDGPITSLEKGVRLALRDFLEQKPCLTDASIAPALD